MEVYQKQKVEAGERTWTVDWHPESKALISAGSNKTITIWSYQQQKLLKRSTITTDHTKTIRTVKFSHKADKIAVGSFDSTISVWVYNNQNQQFEILSTLEGHENQVKCVNWSFNDQRIASCSRDKNIWIWDFDNISYDYVCDSVLEGHTQDVKFVDWFPNSQNRLVSASYDNSIRIWQREDDDYVCQQVLEGHQSIVWTVQITNNYLFSTSEDCSVIQWQLNKQTQKYGLKRIYQGLHSLPIYSLYIFEQKYIVSGGADNAIVFSKIAQEKQEGKNIKGMIVSKVHHQSDINCLKINPKHHDIIASCSDDETIRLWKIEKNEISQ